MSAEQRVPAWKRLGLTLKNAKDIAPEPSSPATNSSSKRSRDDADTPKGSKKQRLDQSATNASTPAPNQSQSLSVNSISSPMPSKLYAPLSSLQDDPCLPSDTVLYLTVTNISQPGFTRKVNSSHSQRQARWSSQVGSLQQRYKDPGRRQRTNLFPSLGQRRTRVLRPEGRSIRRRRSSKG